MRRTFTRTNIVDMVYTYIDSPLHTKIPVAVLSAFALISLMGLMGSVTLVLDNNPINLMSIAIFSLLAYSHALGAAGILGHTPLPRKYHSDQRVYH